MPWPSEKLTLQEFREKVEAFPWRRRITEVHVHHTYRPNHADFRKRGGEACVKGMYDFHIQSRGWSDFGQHVTIDPDGLIWTGRDWNRPPASAVGHNGSSIAGPFMFEAIGDFRSDKPTSQQWHSMVGVISIINKHHGNHPAKFRFHREMQATECPGDISRDRLQRAVMAFESPAEDEALTGPFNDLIQWFAELWK